MKLKLQLYDQDKEAYVRVAEENGDYFLEVKLSEEVFKNSKEIITTAVLGKAFHSITLYENQDGTPFAVDTDLFGNS